MKKKGFTVTELLAVIVILGVVLVLTVPPIIGNLKDTKEEAYYMSVESIKTYLKSSFEKCILSRGSNNYDTNIFDKNCSLKKDNANLLSNISDAAGNEKDIELLDVIEDGRGNFGVTLKPKGSGNYSNVGKEVVSDIPNQPDIENTGLVPIKYDGTNWVVTTKKSSDWFDYSKQEWANAASLKEGVSTTPGTVLRVPDGDTITEENSDIYAMFVWIPRFSYTIGCTDINNDKYIYVDSAYAKQGECLGYKIEGASDLAVYGSGKNSTPGAIDIKFISVNEKDELDMEYNDPSKIYISELKEYQNRITHPKYGYISESDRNPTNWYTHPAFTFGDKELSGIWVGKFETAGSSTAPTILPNVVSLRDQNISTQFATSQKFSASGNVYGITGDAHMAKNSEWAAVAYLSQSKYGKYGNSNYSGALKEIYKNDSSSYYTGRSQGKAPGTSSYSSSGTYKYDVEINGTGASTTGNIYGVYDMVGGAWEHVMGNYNNTVASSGFSSDWLETTENAKYYDILKTSNPFIIEDKAVIGQAFIETLLWENNSVYEFTIYYPWLFRGGSYNSHSFTYSVFFSENVPGSNHSSYGFRSVLVATG